MGCIGFCLDSLSLCLVTQLLIMKGAKLLGMWFRIAESLETRCLSKTGKTKQSKNTCTMVSEVSEQICKERVGGTFPLRRVAVMILEHGTWKAINRT